MSTNTIKLNTVARPRRTPATGRTLFRKTGFLLARPRGQRAIRSSGALARFPSERIKAPVLLTVAANKTPGMATCNPAN